MSDLPAPLTSESADLRSYDWFPLHHKRLRRSRFWVSGSALAKAISVDFWCEAYEQVPAGSLPDDDVFLAITAGFGRNGVDEWLKVKDEVMGQWILCSDGLWYHPTLCEVIEGVLHSQTDKRKAERERKAAYRKSKRLERQSRDVPRDIAAPKTVEKLEDAADRVVDVPPVPLLEERTGEDRTVEEEPAEAGGGQLALIPVDEGPRPKARFDDGWKAYPLKGRKRSGQEPARPLWMRCAKAVGGEDELVECIKRYAASPEALEENGRFVPGFHKWLKLGSAVNWTAEAVAEGGSDGGELRTGARRGDGQRLDRLRSFDASVSRRSDDF